MEFEIYGITGISITQIKHREGCPDGFTLFVCMRACVRACVRACGRVCVCICIYIFIYIHRVYKKSWNSKYLEK